MSGHGDLATPFRLPCGLQCPNRLAKAAMEEMLASPFTHEPNERHYAVYDAWARGGWGLILTGNVQVSPTHLGTPFDIVIPTPSASRYQVSEVAFRRWADRCKAGASTAPVIMQLCHTGRQSARGSGRGPLTPALAPSPVPMQLGHNSLERALSRLLFPTPREMSLEDVADVVRQFVDAAVFAHTAGFDGVQLHCSHGYLLAQFLSPNVNLRQDKYGGSVEKRLTIVLEIVKEIRAKLPASFCVGVKLNSSDYVKGGLTADDALSNVKGLALSGGVDFIEISGGTYENATMLGSDVPAEDAHQDGVARSTAAREAFFVDFAARARRELRSLAMSTPPPAVMVTGGFKTRRVISEVVASGETDLVGIGRPACVEPDVARRLCKAQESEVEAPRVRVEGAGARILQSLPVALFGPGVSTIWHTLALAQLSRGEAVDRRAGLVRAFLREWVAPIGRQILFVALLPFMALAAALLR